MNALFGLVPFLAVMGLISIAVLIRRRATRNHQLKLELDQEIRDKKEKLKRAELERGRELILLELHQAVDNDALTLEDLHAATEAFLLAPEDVDELMEKYNQRILTSEPRPRSEPMPSRQVSRHPGETTQTREDLDRLAHHARYVEGYLDRVIEREIRHHQLDDMFGLEASASSLQRGSSAAAPIQGPDPERWDRVVVQKHRRLRLNVLEAETDWDLLFSAPALTDVTVPETSALYRAMRVAEDSVIDMPENFTSSTELSSVPYIVALQDFEQAWNVAKANALKIGTDQIPADELKTIARIKDLLAIAENRASSANERALAFERISKLLPEVKHVRVPEPALKDLEAKRQLALTE